MVHEQISSGLPPFPRSEDQDILFMHEQTCDLHDKIFRQMAVKLSTDAKPFC
jgi:hypothetical protein